MKVLFFIESLHAGGKERRLVELIKGLSEDKSIDMEIVLTKETIHYKDIFSANIKIHYALRKRLKKDPTVFFKFFRIAMAMKPDIIHVWANMSAIYAIPTKILLKTPMINNQISDAPSKISNSILGHRLTFPFSDRIVANSYAGLSAYKAPRNKSRVIYNGFDLNRINKLDETIAVRNKFNIATKYVIGMIATFSEKKDYTTYIKAANTVLSKEKNITFLCVGSGDTSVFKLMVEPENKNNVLFLGKQDNVENIMNVCDIGVLSTFTEGISNALLEFSALGKPVITTSGGGNVELVKQGKTGYLVNQKSPEELAEKIMLLLGNKTKRIQFGRAGKSRIESDFSIHKMIENFRSLYIEIIAEKKY